MRLRLGGLLIALHAAAAVLFLYATGPGFPLDDAWCHLVYARSLVEGDLFAYNRGQPEAGVSAPLWTALAAGPVALAESALGAWLSPAGRPDLPMRVLGALCGLATGLVALRLAGSRSAWTTGALLVLFAFDPLSLMARFSGMELPLFALLTLLFLEALLLRKSGRAGWIAGLAVLTRPEGWILVALALPEMLSSSARARAFLPRLLLCALPFALYNWAVAGAPWPNTWAHKAELVTDPGQWLAVLSALLHDTGMGWALPAAVLAGVISMEGHSPGCARKLLLAGTALLAGVLLTRSMQLGFDPPRPPFYWERYALVAWPPLLIVAGAGIGSALRSAWAALFCRPLGAAALLAPLLLLALLGRGLPAHFGEVSRRFARECADVEGQQVAAGLWIDRHLPRRATVATHDAGAVRYFGRRYTLDLWGNNDVELAARIRARDSAESEGDGAAMSAAHAEVIRYLQAARPTALACFPLLWAAGQGPELPELLATLPPEEAAALAASADDYAELFGLQRRAVSFRAPWSAVMPGPLQQDFVVFVRP